MTNCKTRVQTLFLVFLLITLENFLLLIYVYGERWHLLSIALQHPIANRTTITGQNINTTWLTKNPIYRKFYVEEAREKKSVTVLVIVSSAPKRVDRRDAIRSTWWTQCVETKEVKPACIFITDYQGPNDQYFHDVREEQKRYKDLHFQLVRGGATFGYRFINHLLFAVHNYQFDYLMRMDDDMFLCLEKFLHELPIPRVTSFHWGWIHQQRNIKRPDEFLQLMSRDTVERFLFQDPAKMVCHPLADQMIAFWLNTLNITNFLRHDSRIHHDPPVRDVPAILKKTNICNWYMALHGAYPNSVKHLWERRGLNVTIKGNLLDNSFLVRTNEPFHWWIFTTKYRYEPKLCIDDPKWDTSPLMSTGTSYGGRQEG